ncbi:uncharacterized protein LOC132796573 [Drosophila nasuta]|uniref:uncharacterized protein LOC132796573 n=1 Tax=Drosophila nasuta TaxID=42062 RepID=UPI00295E35E2|nr:uncharacterized protein LOC132796573 [Drosophila nasuta]
MHCSRIIIITIFFFVYFGSCNPLPARPMLQRRQVVQPTWLLHPSQLATGQAALVRVTPQNLKEAAAIRSSIQKAVKDGSYVVAADPKQYQIALSQLGYNTGMLGASPGMPMFPPIPAFPAMPMMPAFTMPNASWWQQPRLFST